jgi:hypothetical protein
MILHPFGFLAIGGSVPENLTLPSIAFISDNTFEYTAGTWDDTVTSLTYLWYENDVSTGLSTSTYTSSKGKTVKVIETATNDIGSTEGVSNAITVPEVITPAVITQTATNLVTYTAAGVWTPGTTVTSAVWVLNGVPTATAAVLGVSFDARTIGAVNGSVLTVKEFVTPGYGSDLGAPLSYRTLDIAVEEVSGLDFALSGSMIDSVNAVEEVSGLDFNVSGAMTDTLLNISERAQITYTVTGSIV